MANYELPQIRVFQDLDPSIEPSQRAMLPVIIGQVRDIIRYNELSIDAARLAAYGMSSERELGRLGVYDGSSELFTWPTLDPNSTVDLQTVRVYGQNVMVGIQKAAFVEDAPVLSTLHADFDPQLYITPVTAGQENLLIFDSSVNLNGSAFNRAPVVGDYVKVRQTSQDTVGQLEDWQAQVIGLVETLAPRVNEGIATPVEDDANAMDDVANASTIDVTNVVPGDGSATLVDYKLLALTDLASADSTNYGRFVELVTNKACQYGLFDLGDMNYAVRVLNVTSSQVTLSITSSFYNTIKTVNLSEFVLNMTDTTRVWFDGTDFNAANRATAPLGGIVVDDLFVLYAEAINTGGVPVKNDRFTLDGALLNVQQLYNGVDDDTPAIKAGSEFDSNISTTYTIEVVAGGAKDLENGSSAFDPTIQLRVSSSNALDPVTVVTADIQPDGSFDVPVGTKGVVVTFNATSDIIAMARGDRWTISCQGRSALALVGVITDKNFPYFLSASATQRLDFEVLQKIDSVNIPRLQVDSVDNWLVNEDGITMNVYAQLYLDSVSNEVFISSADLFAEYEAVNAEYTGRILTITDSSDTRIGINDQLNPLGYGVRKALLNAQGVPVLAVAVQDMEADMAAALSKLSTNNNAYQIVPLTFDMSQQNEVVAHALAMSTELMDLWRTAYLCTEVGSEYPVIDLDANQDDVTATFVQGPSDLYNKVVLDGSVVDVSFTDANVKPGNMLRFAFGTDMYGSPEYRQFMVSRVLTSTELLVLGDYGSASPSLKIEIHRDTTAEDVIERIGGRAEGLYTRRANMVFPSYAVDDNDKLVPGYFLAAALAGRAAGVEPHQGLTNSRLLGFKSVDDVAPMSRMGTVDLNNLAGHGVTIIQGSQANIGIRHELTTCMLDRKNREAMITRNLDSLSYQYFDALSPFIGIANVTPEFIEKLRTELKAMNGYIISSSRRPLIGSQMISCEIVSIEQNPVLSDKIDMYLRPLLPYPFNYGDLHLQI